jgi:hypothetical protein
MNLNYLQFKQAPNFLLLRPLFKIIYFKFLYFHLPRNHRLKYLHLKQLLLKYLQVKKILLLIKIIFSIYRKPKNKYQSFIVNSL